MTSCTECFKEARPNGKTCSDKCMVARNRRTQKERWQKAHCFTTRSCRRCGSVFIPTVLRQGLAMYLCDPCREVPVAQRKKESQHRADAKRRKAPGTKKEPEPRRILDMDRGKPRNMIRYLADNPVYHWYVFGKVPIEEAVRMWL